MEIFLRGLSFLSKGLLAVQMTGKVDVSMILLRAWMPPLS